MQIIHDTYQIKMRDGKLLFIEISLTEEDSNNNPGMVGYQRIVMERIYKSIKESGYAAKDIETMMPINSTDPKTRNSIKNSTDGMRRLNEFFKLGGDHPSKE